ncbi:DNA-directed RNA polymerase subunit alpha C-terminal domain-containing protein [Actinocorallia aurantiaca]|uniref:RNA polymerase alpha subunit C-terminal domain-containing protein n=1 Tax=Actinocorallia aurantiaca TaxID=46204 RepID=A0ABP6H0V4_9ACTN
MTQEQDEFAEHAEPPWAPPGEVSVRELPLPARVQDALERAGLGRAAAADGYGAAGLMLQAPLLTPQAAQAVKAVLDLLAAMAGDDDLIGEHHCTAGGPPTLYELAALPIEELNLPVRPYNLLKRAGLHSLGDLWETRGPRLADAVPLLDPEGLAAIESALVRMDADWRAGGRS